MKRLGRFTLCGILFMGLCALSARAQVMQSVPANSIIVVKVSNLQDTSVKLAALGQQFALGMFFPEANDPLGSLMKVLKVQAGVDKNGEAALAILDIQPGGPPPMVALVPVSDYNAFLGNFADAKKDGDVTVVEKFGPANAEGTVFIAQWGNYAAISPAKEYLAKKGEGLKLEGATAKLLADKNVDLATYINGKAVREKLLPLLKEKRPGLMQMLDDEMKNQIIEKYRPLLRTLVTKALDIAESALQDTDALTFGIGFGKEGLTPVAMVEFNPDSYMGKLIRQAKNSDATMLSGLPAGDYVVYGGWVQDPKLVRQLLDDLVAPIQKDVAGLGEDGRPIQALIDLLKSSSAACTGGRMAVALDPAGANKGGIVKAVSISEGDAKTIMDGQRKSISAMEDLMKLLPAGARQKAVVKQDAKTVDGVSFDQVTSPMNAGNNTPEEAMANQVMQQIFGANGIVQYVGAADAKHVLTVVGEDEQLMKSAIASVKADEDALGKAANVKEANAKLPQKRLAVVYIALDRGVVAGAKIAGQFTGGDLKIQLPPNLPPIGGTISTEGSAVRMDGYVPTSLIQSLIAAGMQAGMKGRGGGRPGDL